MKTFPKLSPHLAAVLQALLVTFLWSTSWVLIKIGLADIPALTFAGLRYSLAFLLLLPLVLRSEGRAQRKAITPRQWGQLVLLGVLYYAVTQGAQFLGLALLPAVTVSLLLNFTTIMVALIGIPMLGERPGPWQWAGVALSAVGAIIYFYPVVFPAGEILGMAIMLIGVLANAGSSVLGRQINRSNQLPPLIVTTISMGIGGGLLLLSGWLVQGLPRLTLQHMLIIAWLAVVNTAFAFTLWNHTLRTLTAVESSIINSTMLLQIGILAWVFLGERLNVLEIFGLVLAGSGALLVQLRRNTVSRLKPSSLHPSPTQKDTKPEAS